VVESTDLLFAVDSIPAAFAVTKDPFLVLTSNIFAVLGLRALYFALAGLMERFRYLKMSLVFVLAYVGVKLLLSNHFHIPTFVSLAVIAGFLSVGILASIFHDDTVPLHSPLRAEMELLNTVTLRQARSVMALVLCCTLILFGLVFVLAPWPWFVTAFLALAVLGIELASARIWFRRIRR
jgi:tellurite resistance protein TerC